MTDTQKAIIVNAILSAQQTSTSQIASCNAGKWDGYETDISAHRDNIAEFDALLSFVNGTGPAPANSDNLTSWIGDMLDVAADAPTYTEAVKALVTDIGWTEGSPAIDWDDINEGREPGEPAPAPVDWSNLIVTDAEGHSENLSEIIRDNPHVLDTAQIAGGKIIAWAGYFLSRKDEEPDFDTPCGPVAWTGFERFVRACR
jgi:hypothetical protein